MGPWPLCELVQPADIQRAVEDVAVWGYPRPIEPSETACGAWFRMGQGVVFWYERIEEVQTCAFVHLAVAPRVRSRWPVRRWDTAAQIMAELMGFDRLVFFPCNEDLQTPQYALRLGWRAQGDCYVRDLGG